MRRKAKGDGLGSPAHGHPERGTDVDARSFGRKPSLLRLAAGFVLWVLLAGAAFGVIGAFVEVREWDGSCPAPSPAASLTPLPAYAVSAVSGGLADFLGGVPFLGGYGQGEVCAAVCAAACVTGTDGVVRFPGAVVCGRGFQAFGWLYHDYSLFSFRSCSLDRVTRIACSHSGEGSQPAGWRRRPVLGALPCGGRVP